MAQQLAIAAENARLYEVAEAEIAERKKAEEALRVSESAMRQTFDAMPQIAWSVGGDAKVNYVNRRLVEYAGASDPSETMGERGWASVVHPDDSGLLRSVYAEAVQSGREWEAEIRLRRHDGEYRWHLSRMVPIRDLEGQIVRWFGTSTDIHDLKLANSTLEQINTELEQRVELRTAELQAAVRELEGFTYSISHDLRGPLRTISATSRILLTDMADRLSEDMEELLVRQATAATRLGTLIDELLRLSRISRHEMVMEHVDISALASVVADEVRAENWEIPPKFDIQTGLFGNGDERLLKLVIHNLLQNAVKFSPAGADIHVGIDSNGAYFIRDSGVGFDMRFSDKLWLPFERLVHDNEFPGTGIGLANVKRIIERHGGRVWAESALGQGSTFFFTLGQIVK